MLVFRVYSMNVWFVYIFKFTYMDHTILPNVGKYTMHGWYEIGSSRVNFAEVSSLLDLIVL